MNIFDFSNLSTSNSSTIKTDNMVDIDKNNLVDLVKSNRLIAWSDDIYEAISKVGMRPIYRLKYQFGGFQLEFITVVAKNSEGVKSEFILYKDDEGNLRLGYNCIVVSNPFTELEMIYNDLISNNIISDTSSNPYGLKCGVSIGAL